MPTRIRKVNEVSARHRHLIGVELGFEGAHGSFESSN